MRCGRTQRQKAKKPPNTQDKDVFSTLSLNLFCFRPFNDQTQKEELYMARESQSEPALFSYWDDVRTTNVETPFGEGSKQTGLTESRSHIEIDCRRGKFRTSGRGRRARGGGGKITISKESSEAQIERAEGVWEAQAVWLVGVAPGLGLVVEGNQIYIPTEYRILSPPGIWRFQDSRILI